MMAVREEGAAVRSNFVRRPVTFCVVATALLAFGATAHGDAIVIFSDDFEGYPVGTNPTIPPIGEPWQITEVVDSGISVEPDPMGSVDRVLTFGYYRNKALAPFSAAARAQSAQAQNAIIHFSYADYSSGGFSQYFDVAAHDPISGDPAFLIRFAPEENPASGGLHDVLYLDPAGGLVDSTLDIRTGIPQTLSIIADFAAGNYELHVAGDVATLPMFVCPEEIVGVEFANYGGSVGSGSIDDLTVTVEETAPSTPELATITLLAIGGLTLAAWTLWRDDAGKKDASKVNRDG